MNDDQENRLVVMKDNQVKNLLASLLVAAVGCLAFWSYEAQVRVDEYYDKVITPEDAWNIYNKGYSSNMFGNLLNKYNASVTFYENQNQVGSPFYIM
jgi:hypothetical protein